jgi:hypothetical protein
MQGAMMHILLGFFFLCLAYAAVSGHLRGFLLSCILLMVSFFGLVAYIALQPGGHL